MKRSSEKMNILHVFKNTNEKFYNPYIKFINRYFDSNDHFFAIQLIDKRTKIVSENNVNYISGIKYFLLIKDFYKFEKIILHSLMSPMIVLILFLQPWLLKKCYWVVWGADLYYFKNRERNLKTNIYEFLRRYVIRNMGGLITHVKGDYELAKEWYGFKGKYYYSFMYPSNLYHEYDLPKQSKSEDKKLYVQVGNSADPSNNHLEVFDKLRIYKDEELEIICPLSYGDIGYRNRVIDEGKKFFGDKFIPLIEFMPFNDYLKVLSKIDVAIFNHKRQQAMGNIITLLGLGKKVYIRDDITTWNSLLNLGIKVYDSNSQLLDLYEKIPSEESIRNMDIVRKNFSEEKLLEDLQRIFY